MEKSFDSWWNKTGKVKKIAILAFFFLALIVYSNYTVVNWQRLFSSDMFGYYQWLPSSLINFDPLSQPYAFLLADGTPFNRYSYGVALMILPFFLVSHLVSLVFGLDANGYTAVYGASMVFASVSWVFFGMILLFKFLKKYFSILVSLLSLFLILFGSNLFFYTSVESGMSHAYSFALIACIIYMCPKFWDNPSFRNTLLLSLPLALAVIIRPINIVIVFFIFLYGVHSWKSLRERFFQLPLLWNRLLIMIIVGFVFLMPQSLYWHATTGDWLTYPYKYSFTENETFRNLGNPRILQVLAGSRSGWIPYSPLMLFAITGLFRLVRINKYSVWGILISFCLVLYLDASWWLYTFACGFGYRALVDFYALLAIPFAASLTWIFTKKMAVLKISLVLLCCILIFANLRMSYLYHKRSCWDGKNWGWPQYNLIWNKVFNISNHETPIPPFEFEENSY